MKVRIAKKKIPYGIYCYGLDKNGKRVYCPHYDRGLCKFINDRNAFIYDHCKECFVRDVVPPRVIKQYVKQVNGDTKLYRDFRKQESS